MRQITDFFKDFGVQQSPSWIVVLVIVLLAGVFVGGAVWLISMPRRRKQD